MSTQDQGVPKQRLQEGKTTLTSVIVAKLSLGTITLAEEASPHHAIRMGNDAKSTAMVSLAKLGARISPEMHTKHPNRWGWGQYSAITSKDHHTPTGG
jgi:hypothetical protein